MRKVIAVFSVAALVVVGAVAAVAQTDDTDEDAPVRERIHEPGEILAEVLEGFVPGTLTEDEVDEILAAVEAKHEELRAEREAHRAEMEQFRDQMHSFLEDGQLTADELAQLPEDHPLLDPDGPAVEYLEDGQLTADELTELRSEFGPHRGPGGHGHGMHRGGFGPGPEMDGAGFGLGSDA
jgi:hypothetical protein